MLSLPRRLRIVGFGGVLPSLVRPMLLRLWLLVPMIFVARVPALLLLTLIRLAVALILVLAGLWRFVALSTAGRVLFRLIARAGLVSILLLLLVSS